MVPELIIKGQEGLNLVNIEELMSDTVNMAKLLVISISAADNMSSQRKDHLSKNAKSIHAIFCIFAS